MKEIPDIYEKDVIKLESIGIELNICYYGTS